MSDLCWHLQGWFKDKNQASSVQYQMDVIYFHSTRCLNSILQALGEKTAYKHLTFGRVM